MSANSRRTFLKAAGLFTAVPFVDSLSRRGELLAAPVKFALPKNGEIYTAAHWGVLKVTLKGGKIVKSENGLAPRSMPNPFHATVSDLIYAKDRIKYPMVRRSFLKDPDNSHPELRGKDEWVRVPYKDAIKLVAKRLKKVRKEKGASGIFAGSYGWKSSGNTHNSRILLHRFMNLTGGFVGSAGDYSTGASQVIMPHVMGSIEVYEQQTSWPLVLANAKVVVIWGANPISMLRIAWTSNEGMGLEYFKKLRDSGIKVICIDPIKNETCEFLKARWIAPVPNTDVALMLAMAHTLLVKDKYDKEFIENYTEGFDKFKDYLLGKEDGKVKDAKWASEITSIPAKDIEDLALMFYENPTMFMSGWGMQRAHHGEQPHWALVALCSMLGQIGKPGTGFGLSYHYSNGGVPTTTGAVIGGMNAGVAQTAGTGQSWLQKSAAYSFPVARIADALLNPGKTIYFNGKKVTYTDIDFIYWVGGNPVVHHQDTNNFAKALQKPSTIVVNELYWTPTARMADVVFPITTPYERNDITMTGDYSNMHIAPMKQVVAKQFGAVDDYKVFSDLAAEFGVKKQFTEGKDEMAWIEEFYGVALKQARAKKLDMPSFKEFWKAGKPIGFEADEEAQNFTRYADFIEDPILSLLGTPSGKIEIYSKTIEKMQYDDCPAHPAWMEPVEWLGMKNKPADRLHSQMNNIAIRKTYAIADKEPIWINTQDAKAKGLKTGDVVRVFNARGQVLAGAFVTDKIRRGVVKLSEGAWWDPSKDPSGDLSQKGTRGALCKNGSANVLTLDMPTSKLAMGNISHTALVNVEKFTGKIEPLSVFKQP